MSDDFIERAEALIQPMHEIKHLRADNKFLHKFVDDPGSTLEAALNAVREQSDVIQKQQVAFADAITTAAATLAKWQAIAIDERANQIAGIPVSHLKDKYKRNAYREQAAKELDLQEDDIPTIACMLGSQKANERLKVLQGYVERLETAFLAAERDRAHHLNLGWRDEDEPEMTWDQATQEAQATLVKIREGT